MMQSSPCNICNLRADCLFRGYAGRKNRFVCIANLEQTIGKCYICPILPEDVLSVKFATGGNRENSFRKRRLNKEGKKKGTALSFSSPLAHSFFRCLPGSLRQSKWRACLQAITFLSIRPLILSLC